MSTSSKETGTARLSVVTSPARKRLRILIVDGDETSLQKARQALQTVLTAKLKYAATAEAASALVASERFDLVVVDAAVEGGLSLLKQIKDLHRWVATLVVSDDQSPSFMRQIVKCQIDGLLFRPISREEFVEQVMLLAFAVATRRKRQQKRVLAIGAHPDDVEIGCGGALAKHHAAGDLLHILTMSRGAAGGDVNVRTVEARHAASLLGAELHLGSLVDTHITDGRETVELIESVIRQMQPTHVYTHCNEDTHQDHRAVHAATLVAARGVSNLYCYQSPSSTVDFKPQRFVDITDFIGTKLQAIDAYCSQTERMAALEPDNIVSTARYWGRFAGHILAEPLRVVRQSDNEEGRAFDTAGLGRTTLRKQA